MPQHIVVLDRLKDWHPTFPEVQLVSAEMYLSHSDYYTMKGLHLINLCRSYRYLSTGYYCSLLAEARHHKVIPSVQTLTELRSKAIYSLSLDDIDVRAQRSMRKYAAPSGELRFELFLFFGQVEVEPFQELARQLYDSLRCPLLKVGFRHQGGWHLQSIRPLYLHQLTAPQREFFAQTLTRYLSTRWRVPRSRQNFRYDMAILHNPNEDLPPSNRGALQKFVQVGRKLGVHVELIEKKDFSRLGEYDALFIRETTAIDHHTYRFAKKAEAEGIVVMDDPESIVKCTNKVYLAELVLNHRLPAPKTVILQKQRPQDIDGLLDYPVVLKIPDGSFSRGVFKAGNRAEFEAYCERLFKDSDLILAQEFLYTDFDWRIGVLNHQPLFACQYFMSKAHWQIVKHEPGGKAKEGDYKAWPIDQVPSQVLNAALAVARLIGDGLYGVDMKQNDAGVFIIEVNDNPNIETGVEDAVLGDALYVQIMMEFVRRLEQRRSGLRV